MARPHLPRSQVGELKQLLSESGVDFRDCFEKAELVGLGDRFRKPLDPLLRSHHARTRPPMPSRVAREPPGERSSLKQEICRDADTNLPLKTLSTPRPLSPPPGAAGGEAAPGPRADAPGRGAPPRVPP